MARLAKTSTGATNSAIWMPLPTAMLTARSIWFFIATSTAVECSAALPTIATTITPTNTELMPNEWAACSAESTSSSLITATPTVAAISTTQRLSASPGRRVHGRRFLGGVRRFAGLEDLPVRDERKHQAQHVDHGQDQRDLFAERFDRGDLCGLQGQAGGERVVIERRHHQPDRGQGQQRGAHAGGGAIEMSDKDAAARPT